MAEYKTVNASDVIKKFQYALLNIWGYIMGTAGVIWTEAKQKQKVNYMVSKYGTNWKNDPAAKKDKFYYAAKDGAKWIGHTVADCSGLFHWAYEQLGGYMYHGSNTMYNKYCSSKGALKSGKRLDGKELKPGSAVFTGTASDHGHVGLYIGNGEVIEASGTIAGVIISKVTLAKWTFWGELINTNYNAEPTPPEPVPHGKAIVTGTKVALRSGPSLNASVILRVNTGEIVTLEDPDPDWEYVGYNNKKGYMMKKFLKEG